MSNPSPEQSDRLKHQQMMAKGEGCKVALIGLEEKEKPGEVRIQQLNLALRALRALKLLGIYWGIAVVSVLVPIAHFVLVPGFLVAGLIIAGLALATKSLVLGGEGICPNCEAFLPIVQKKDKWPLTDRCDQCHTNITITRD